MAKKRLSRPVAEFADYYDLADTLVEKYNDYCSFRLEDYIPLEVDLVIELLKTEFYMDEVKVLLDDDFGRGIVMGLITARIQLEAEYGVDPDGT